METMQDIVVEAVETQPQPDTKLTPKFENIERVRKSMLITMAQLAELIGVTRATYYNWVQGKPVKHVNKVKLKAVMNSLVSLAVIHNWPTQEALQASRKERFELLKTLLKNLDSEPVPQ